MRCARCSTSSTASAAVADRGERVEDDVDDARREPERRLVEEQHVGLRDQRAGDRELLLLAAGERARVRRAELARRREERVGALERGGGAGLRAPAGEAEPEVLLDGELAEDAPSFRDERDPASRDVFGRAADERGAAEADRRRPRRAPRP